MENQVRTRLKLSMTVMVLLIFLIGTVGYVTISREVQAIEKTIKLDVSFITSASQLRIKILQLRRFEKDYFLNIGNRDNQEEYLKKYNDIVPSLQNDLTNFSEMAKANEYLSEDIKRQIKDLPLHLKDYLDGFHKVLQQMQADPTITPQKANALMESYKAHIPTYEKEIEAIDDAGRKMLETVTAQAIKRGKRAKSVIVSAIIAGVIFAMVLGSILSRSIYRAVLSEGFRRLAGQ